MSVPIAANLGYNLCCRHNYSKRHCNLLISFEKSIEISSSGLGGFVSVVGIAVLILFYDWCRDYSMRYARTL